MALSGEATNGQGASQNAAEGEKIGSARTRDIRAEHGRQYEATKRKARHSVESVGEDYTEYDEPITREDLEALRSIGRKSVNDFTSEDIKKAQKWAYKFYQELGVKSPFFRAWFGEWRAHEKVEANIVRVDVGATIASGNAINKDTGRKLSWSKDLAKESELNAPKQYKGDIAVYSTNIGKIVENAILLDTVVSDRSSARKLEGTAWMHSMYALVEHDGKTSLIKMFAEEAFSQKTGETFTRAYTLKYIQKVAEIDNGVHSQKRGLTGSHSTTIYSIADLYEFVKHFDKDFTAAHNVSKAVLNEDGRPKVFDYKTAEGKTLKVFKNDAGQIKSAETGLDANIGTFDRAEGNIYHAVPSAEDAKQQTSDGTEDVEARRRARQE